MDCSRPATRTLCRRFLFVPLYDAKHGALAPNRHRPGRSIRTPFPKAHSSPQGAASPCQYWRTRTLSHSCVLSSRGTVRIPVTSHVPRKSDVKTSVGRSSETDAGVSGAACSMPATYKPCSSTPPAAWPGRSASIRTRTARTVGSLPSSARQPCALDSTGPDGISTHRV